MPDVLVRSTLLASSRDGLLRAGHLPAYERVLGPEWAEALRDATMVTQWLPMEYAVSHYRGADALGLDDASTLELGNVAAARLNGTLWGTLAKAAKSGGVTPWAVLRRSERFWRRMYQHDRIEMTETGPRSASVHIAGNALADVSYWRRALVGLLHGGMLVFADQAEVVLAPQESRGTSTYHLEWR